jgi:DNA-binding response OmpR family regulator
MSKEQPHSACVVVADDEPGMVELLGVVLEPVAATVIVAKDGAAAWRAIQEHRPTVAVLDADMPRLSGLDVVRLVRGSADLEATRTLLITAHAGVDAAAAEAGADRSLTKPFSPTVLRGVVRELLAQAA